MARRWRAWPRCAPWVIALRSCVVARVMRTRFSTTACDDRPLGERAGQADGGFEGVEAQTNG
jgi:hypothetical protein